MHVGHIVVRRFSLGSLRDWLIIFFTVKLNDGEDFDTIHVGQELSQSAQQTGDIQREPKKHDEDEMINDSPDVNGGLRTGSDVSSRLASIVGGGDVKIGFRGKMQQLLFDGREVSDLDTDEIPGTGARNDIGLVKSTASIDVDGGSATFTSSEAYAVIRTTRKDRQHHQLQQQQQQHAVSPVFSVYFQVNL
jgi:hypothetical protein